MPLVFAENDDSNIENLEDEIHQSIESLNEGLMQTNASVWISANLATITSIVFALFAIIISASISLKKIQQSDRKFVLGWIGIGIGIGALLAILLFVLSTEFEIPDLSLLFAGISASGVFVSMIFFTIQIRQKKKVESADFTLRLIKKIYNDHKDMIDLIHANGNEPEEILEYDINQLERFLGEIETVSMFVKDKVVNRKYAYEMFSTVIETIRDDQQIQQHLTNTRDEDPEMYSNIAWLDENIDDWGDY